MTKGETLQKINRMIEESESYDQLATTKAYVALAEKRGKLWHNLPRQLNARIDERMNEFLKEGDNNEH